MFFRNVNPSLLYSQLFGNEEKAFMPFEQRPYCFHFSIYIRFGRKKTVISTLALAGVFCSIVGGMSDLEKNSHSMGL